jgi:hypothetical protein
MNVSEFFFTTFAGTYTEGAPIQMANKPNIMLINNFLW